MSICSAPSRSPPLATTGYGWRAPQRAAAMPASPRASATAQFFATRMLSQVPALCANVRQSAEELMLLDAANFYEVIS